MCDVSPTPPPVKQRWQGSQVCVNGSNSPFDKLAERCRRMRSTSISHGRHLEPEPRRPDREATIRITFKDGSGNLTCTVAKTRTPAPLRPALHHRQGNPLPHVVRQIVDDSTESEFRTGSARWNTHAKRDPFGSRIHILTLFKRR